MTMRGRRVKWVTKAIEAAYETMLAAYAWPLAPALWLADSISTRENKLP